MNRIFLVSENTPGDYRVVEAEGYEVTPKNWRSKIRCFIQVVSEDRVYKTREAAEDRIKQLMSGVG